METYTVYMNNVPKVSEDGKPIPIAPHRSQEFSELEEAQSFAAQHKDDFERVTLMRLSEDKKRMIERYMDGEHIINDKPEPEDAPAEVEASAEPETSTEPEAPAEAASEAAGDEAAAEEN